MRARILRFCFLVVVLAGFVQPVGALGMSQVSSNNTIIDFPNTITFSARLQSPVPINSVVLEYGTQQLTCGEVVAKAFPEFTPGTSVQVEWIWDMRQAGSLPPGASIWWRWRYTDDAGKETLSEEKIVTWLDSDHPWKTLEQGLLRLHWYGRDQRFAETMLQVGLDGLNFNAEQSGLDTDMPIDLYVYPNYEDMRDAILYEPSWTGGMAFSEHNVVILGLSGSDTAWDENTLVHELTHVLVGHLTFSCLTVMPTWLNEGLAVYSEQGLDPDSAAQLQESIRADRLLSVRSLSEGFSEVPDKAYLSYSQSYSIVKYLIETHGQQKMTDLLNTLREGVSIDDALMDTYGFNVDGLEDAWRESVGAAPRQVSGLATAQPTPTYVPTIVPVFIGGASGSTTPAAVPTSSFNLTPVTERSGAGSGPPLALTLLLIGSCCIFGLLAGVIILMVFIKRSPKKEGNNVTS